MLDEDCVKFDFLVLSAHGAAEHAIFRYLELHPDIFPTCEDSTDEAVSLKYAAPAKHIFRDRIRTGWVYSDMDRFHDDPDRVAGEILHNMKTKLLIQTVRDPVRLLLSVYNNSIKNHHSGAKPAFSVEELFMKHVHTAFFHEYGSRLGAHFDRWEVFDTSDITGVKTPGTLKRIFELLGVPADEAVLNHPSLKIPQNTLAQSFLRIIQLDFPIQGEDVKCMLQTEGSLDSTGVRNPNAFGPDARYEIVGGWIKNVPPEIKAALNASSLNVMVDLRDWIKIHPKIRALLIRYNSLGKAFESMVIPPMMESLGLRVAQPKLALEDLPKDLIDKVKTRIAPDARALFRKEPSLREKWDICGDL